MYVECYHFLKLWDLIKSDLKDYFFYKNKKSVLDGDRFATHN